jgi:hypothetical protein
MTTSEKFMKKVFIPIGLLILSLAAIPCQSKQLDTESFYVQKWCRENNGHTGNTSPEGVRYDCLTNEYAVDCAFGEKWSETIGQSLFNAMETNKKAGICLIIKKPQDQHYWSEMNRTIMHYQLPIRTWIVQP